MADNMMKYKAIALIGCAILMGGCAGTAPVKEEGASVSGSTPASASPSCCAKIGDFNFPQIEPGKVVNFQISESSPKTQFDGELQHFHAFKVPENFEPSAMIVRSHLSSGFLPWARAFRPRLVYLDGNFQEIANALPENMQHKSDFFGSGFEGKAVVPAQARYIAVIANIKNPTTWMMRLGADVRHSIKPADFGDLSVTLYGDFAKK
jgi:hypothetical protein